MPYFSEAEIVALYWESYKFMHDIGISNFPENSVGWKNPSVQEKIHMCRVKYL